MKPRLSRADRREIVRAYLAGEKTSGQLARKYQIHRSYPRVLAHRRIHGRVSRAR